MISLLAEAFEPAIETRRRSSMDGGLCDYAFHYGIYEGLQPVAQTTLAKLVPGSTDVT